MLYIKIDTASELREQFRAYNRDNYSYESYECLVDYFEEFDEPEELDVIAICCDFSEESEEEFRRNFDLAEDEDIESWLSYNGAYFRILNNGNIFYQNF